MKTYLVAYAATLVVFLAIDAIWLGLVARDLYRTQLGELMSPQPILSVAAVFYALYVVGVVIFAISPALGTGSWTTALLYGALFGFFAYGTYDLTNLATIRNWPPLLTAVDLTWGTVLTGVSATAGFLAARAWGS